MIDEFGNETTAPNGGERVAFCQDCGKPLTRETVRTVGSGVFCEPCLETRVGAAGQTMPPVGTGPVTGAYGTVPPPPMTHLPSPTLAGFLGLIPGVGAMYNGQFAKGIAHIVIFFVLSSLSDHVNGAFGILVAGWVFYQAFEAYHTAKARLVGDPLPNPFGLNDIGERMGFGKSWPGSPSRPPMNPPVTQWNPVTPPATAAPTAVPVPPVPPANWTGYVPPSAFSQPTPPPAAAASQGAGWGSVPYQAPPQAQYVPVDPGATLPTAVVPPMHSRRFPVAAIVLIVLGSLFLLNTIMHFALNGSWITAAILATLAVWIFAHRISHMHRDHPEGLQGAAMVSCLLRGPSIMLAVLAVLFALQAANLYTLGQTWSVIVIAFGAMLLIERASGRAAQSTYIDPRSPMTPAWATEPAMSQGPAQASHIPTSHIPTHDDTENGGQR